MHYFKFLSDLFCPLESAVVQVSSAQGGRHEFVASNGSILSRLGWRSVAARRPRSAWIG